MEQFGAQPNVPIDVRLREARKSDVVCRLASHRRIVRRVGQVLTDSTSLARSALGANRGLVATEQMPQLEDQ
jgi:hypothetical protein